MLLSDAFPAVVATQLPSLHLCRSPAGGSSGIRHEISDWNRIGFVGDLSIYVVCLFVDLVVIKNCICLCTVIRWTGSQRRVSNYRNRKVVGASDAVEFSNVAANEITLVEGRCVIVPYTHTALSVSSPHSALPMSRQVSQL